MELQNKIFEEVKKLEGPIVIFGAGGFIGANLFLQIKKYRNDVYAITTKSYIPWRLEDADKLNILQCDITKKDKLDELFFQFKFKTIFHLAAYGAYSKQSDVDKIYETNFKGLLHLLDISSHLNIKAIVHAGSSSEYGINCEAPAENSELIPNSHYAVSKTAASHLIKYFGILKNIPIVNLRYYSVYGPYEEPDRLIPQLIDKGINHQYPNLVQPEISRDFIYIDDTVYATLLSANADFNIIKGKSINIGTGRKTTLREIVDEIKNIFEIQTNPAWGEMPNRKWDLVNWFGNIDLAHSLLHFKADTSLNEGLKKTLHWQKDFAYPLYEKRQFQEKITHKISAVIACYKDNLAIPIMHKRLTDVFKKIGVDHEIIFVNDCSPDNTAEVINNIVQEDYNVIGIEHSRNFGSQAAFLSGMEISTGDAVVLLDGDLQDPPELIEQFYEEYKNGYEVIYGRRVAREGNKMLVSFYKLFYRLFRKVSYVPIPLDAGDFSLMDRKVVDQLIALPETDQFMRGLRAWVGFKQTGVDYVRPERMFGTTTNNWRKNIAWARKAIFSFSFVPLELLTYIGWTLTALSFIAIIAQVVAYFLYRNIPHGITSIIVLILFFGGLNMLAVSIIGEYQAKILEETKRRPKFIRKKIIKKANNK